MFPPELDCEQLLDRFDVSLEGVEPALELAHLRGRVPLSAAKREQLAVGGIVSEGPVVRDHGVSGSQGRSSRG